MITQLTHWVIDQALSDLRTLQKIQPGLGGMAINVSARDLLSAGGLEEQFAQSLARHQLEAGHVTVELTETAAMDDPEKGLEALADCLPWACVSPSTISGGPAIRHCRT